MKFRTGEVIVSPPGLFVFFFSLYGDHRDLPSFPTRRSSDPRTRDRQRDVAEHLPARGTVDQRRRFQLHRRSEEHTSELQSLAYLVCRLLLEKKKNTTFSFLTLQKKKTTSI